MPFIVKSRGLSRAIGMSQLLDTSPEIKVCAAMPACAACVLQLRCRNSNGSRLWRQMQPHRLPPAACMQAFSTFSTHGPTPVLPPCLQSIIDRGELVPDHMVLDALLEVVLNPEVSPLQRRCCRRCSGWLAG